VADGNPDFYGELVGRLVRTGVLTTDHEVLVICGGVTDREVLRRHGLRRVTITNVDLRADEAAFKPYQWSHQDAERLAYDDGSFDFCIVHSGLHHCHSPHRALLEMYRVSQRGLLLFDPYDNLLTRLGVRLNIGQHYEHAAVHFNGLTHGGVANGAIPNHIYRFTEREITKTIHSYAPYAPHEIRFFYSMRIPWAQLRARRGRALYYAVRLARPGFSLLERCMPKQSNNFAALVLKPDLSQTLHPWLRRAGDCVVPDAEWLRQRYA
jgi:SAM-dependent methyltransferase